MVKRTARTTIRRNAEGNGDKKEKAKRDVKSMKTDKKREKKRRTRTSTNSNLSLCSAGKAPQNQRKGRAPLLPGVETSDATFGDGIWAASFGTREQRILRELNEPRGN